jgi:hypothetical protein
MLELDREIRRRLGTLKKFDTKYQDSDDLDSQNKPKEKPYIPVSLRTKLSVSCSPLVQKDGRCAQQLAAIQTAQECTRMLHKAYKTNVAAKLKAIAEIELTARRKLFGFTYSQSILMIAKGLVIIAKNMPGQQPLEMDVTTITKLVTAEAIAELSPNHWRDARFVPTNGDRSKVLETFVMAHLSFHNISEEDINKLQSSDSVDKAIASYVVRKLEEWWPILTHLLWSADVKRDTKKLDAKLSELFKSKAIVKANKKLADTMETGADQTIKPLIKKSV